MAKKNFWIGMLAMLLVFAMAVAGCDNGSANGNDDEKEETVFLPYNLRNTLWHSDDVGGGTDLNFGTSTITIAAGTDERVFTVTSAALNGRITIQNDLINNGNAFVLCGSYTITGNELSLTGSQIPVSIPGAPLFSMVVWERVTN